MVDAIPHRRPPPPLLDDACALFLDVDGTLLEFELHPDLVGLPLGALEVIGRVSDRLAGALALVSGRPLSELDHLFSPREFPAAGLHGQQFRGVVAPQPVRSGDALSALRLEAMQLAERHPGVIVEDKGANLALHWRAAPGLASSVMQWAEARLPGLQGYRLQPGDHVIELVPADVDKGRALRLLMAELPFKGRTPVFVGDDLTDEFGFAAANAVGGWSVQVGTREPSQAQYRLADPAAVHAWLRRNAAPARHPGNPMTTNRTMARRMEAANLDLGVIGNGSFGALVDARARVVWSCLPAFDGDPAFCALLSPRDHDGGDYAIELEDYSHSEQAYLHNTAILRTVLHDRHGGAVEIIDFAPRWREHERFFRPVMLVRRVTPLSGNPRIRVRARPLADWGARLPESTWGSNHVRWLLPDFTLRLTTDVPVRFVREETPFVLAHPVHLVLGADESLARGVAGFVREAQERTTGYWREWVRYLSIPLDWQEAVIRSAITLKLCQYEDSGAIIAAMSTSIPEAPDTPRNWDYRYCWLRDAAFVVRALNRLGATRSMEEFLRYIFNIATSDGSLQPLYGINFEEHLHEYEVESLAGYRGMGPVRRGNLAWVQKQHDVYGSVILASTQLFFDQRLADPGDVGTFARLEPLGERAFALHDVPDAGLWEFRGRAEVHTYTSVMCWAACDRLAKIADKLGLEARQAYWRGRADAIHARVIEQSWNGTLGHFTDTFGGERLDASLLLLADMGFVQPDDPRFIGTVEAIGRDLKRGDALFRYVAPDDFGSPETSFTICTFWYIDALAAIGRKDEARELFERILARRNPLGLLSEDLAFDGGEAWGNFPQTYSHVGLIIAAMRLSRSWQEAS